MKEVDESSDREKVIMTVNTLQLLHRWLQLQVHHIVYSQYHYHLKFWSFHNGYSSIQCVILGRCAVNKVDLKRDPF